MSTPAVIANATLNGHHHEVPADSWVVTPRQVKVVTEPTAGGHRREAVRYTGAGRERIRRKREFRIDWGHLRDMRRTLEELLAGPGPHTLALWRRELFDSRADGYRTEFTMPWSLAVDDAAGEPPTVAGQGRFIPEVKVGRAGALLTAVTHDVATYSTGTPAVGEVWFLSGGRTFKLAAPPAADEIVFAWVVPLFEVFETPEHSARFADPLREPRVLTLVEA